MSTIRDLLNAPKQPMEPAVEAALVAGKAAVTNIVFEVVTKHYTYAQVFMVTNEQCPSCNDPSAAFSYGLESNRKDMRNADRNKVCHSCGIKLAAPNS